MKQLLPLLFLATASVAGIAADKVANFEGYKSTDGFEEYRFLYNSNYQVCRLEQDMKLDPQFNCIIEVDYDDKGREVQERLYQDMDEKGGWNVADFHWNSYIDYEYNDANQLVKRINYMMFKGQTEWQRGGIMTYTYNEDGTLKDINTYFDDALKDAFQVVSYTYDDQKRISEINTSTLDYTVGDLVNDTRLIYSYNEQGYLKTIERWAYSTNTQKLELNAYTNYTYDENGNLLEEVIESPSHSVQGKYVYSYNEPGVPFEVSGIAWPTMIEDFLPFENYDKFRTQAPKQMEDYEIDQTSNTLMLYATYEYNYGAGSGVRGVIADKVGNFALAGLSKDNVKLNGISNDMVRIYDLQGRLVKMTNARNGMVNISDLAAGEYCVSTLKGTVKIRK